MFWPPGNEWNTDTSFVALAFQSFQLSIASEEFRIGSSFFVGSVIGCKDDDGVLVKSFLLEFCENFAHILVQSGNHSSKLGMGMYHGVVSRIFPSSPGFVVEKFLLVVLYDRIFWLCQLGMWKGIGEETCKRMLGILLVDPFQCFVVNDAGRILITLEVVFAKHRILDVLFHHFSHYSRISQSLAISVQEIRVVEMCLKLTDVSIEFIHAPFVGSRGRTFISACPLAENARSVTFVLEHLWQNLVLWVVRFLSYDRILFVFSVFYHWNTSPVFLVSSYMGMPGMLTSHDRGSGWC